MKLIALFNRKKQRKEDVTMLNTSPSESQAEATEINSSSSDSSQEGKATHIQALAIPKPLPPCPVHGTRNVRQIKGKKYFCNPFKHNFFAP